MIDNEMFETNRVYGVIINGEDADGFVENIFSGMGGENLARYILVLDSMSANVDFVETIIGLFLKEEYPLIEITNNHRGNEWLSGYRVVIRKDEWIGMDVSYGEPTPDSLEQINSFTQHFTPNHVVQLHEWEEDLWMPTISYDY